MSELGLSICNEKQEKVNRSRRMSAGSKEMREVWERSLALFKTITRSGGRFFLVRDRIL